MQARTHGERAMTEPTTTAAAGTGFVIGGGLLVGLIATVLALGLTPPRTRSEMCAMVAASFGSSLFIGPLVIEYYGLTGYGFQAQLGVCFMVAAPAWLLWRIVSNQLARWRDAKNPIQVITKDIRDARRGR